MSKDDTALRMLAKLVYALQRRGSEQDGNWGFPSFHEELKEIQAEIAARLAENESNSQG